jgi:beta-1,4-mannooligosaccharide/beta-1,4-mannosyl-N-acetylglucosamine phosphorylase
MERHPKNPILTRNNIPNIPPYLIDVTSVFNPGAIKFNGKYILILRVQSRSRETFLVKAESANGIQFNVSNEIVRFKGIERVKEKIFHIYDARIIELEKIFYIMFAMDMENGCQLGLGKTMDFKSFEFIGIVSSGDIRNGVLFPERVQGRYLRLDRPNTSRREEGPTSGSTIWLSESDDLIRWKPAGPVIDGRFHYWDEHIGSGPPPVKTREGWLHIYHGVATHFNSVNIYQAGVILLDLNDPLKVISRCRENILEPREIYELTGQVPNVVFPCGMIVENFDADGFANIDSPVKVYYGAADTVVGLAVTTVRQLLASAHGEPIV